MDLINFAVAVPRVNTPVIVAATDKGAALRLTREHLISAGIIEPQRDIRMRSVIVPLDNSNLGDKHPSSLTVRDVLRMAKR